MRSGRVDRRGVVDTAMRVLATVGLPDLTMRRLATELGVQPSALYHHFASKQELLGVLSDEILARGPSTEVAAIAGWRERAGVRCSDLRAAVLAVPDGADVVSSMFAFGLGGSAPHARLVEDLASSGLGDQAADTAARTLLHFVYGHAVAQQAREQAARVGAIEAPPVPDDFAVGLEFVLAGIEAAAISR